MNRYESTGKFINICKDVKIFSRTNLTEMPTNCRTCTNNHCKEYSSVANVRPLHCPLVKGVEVK